MTGLWWYLCNIPQPTKSLDFTTFHATFALEVTIADHLFCYNFATRNIHHPIRFVKLPKAHGLSR